jgi:hypothetical protein
MCRMKGVFSHTTKPVWVLKDEYIWNNWNSFLLWSQPQVTS